MIRKLLYLVLLSSIYTNAQTTIVEEKYEKKNEPVSFKYLPNSKKFIVFKGESISMTLSYVITNALSFDISGKKSTLFENENFVSCTFSNTENSFKAYDATKKSSENYKYFLNSTSQFLTNDEALKDVNFNYFGRYDSNNVLVAIKFIRPTIPGLTTFMGSNTRISRMPNEPFSASFNDFYDFGFTNQKGKDKIDFEKDDIYLERVEIKTKNKNRIKLEKPDLSLLIGDSFVKSDSETTFNCKLNGNKNFDLITKSVSNDSKTTILYKTTYDFEGKKLKVIPLTLHLDNNFFIASDNNGGPKLYHSSPSYQTNYNSASVIQDVSVSLDVLSINNYYEDRSNGDIYVYGIYSNKASKNINSHCYPNGFYIFKFDKDGNKIWESINNIVDKEYFQKIRNPELLQVDLLEYNNNLIFSVSVNAFTEFSNATIVDKLTGGISKISFIEYNNNASKGKNKAFVSNTYVGKDLKNKVFSQRGFVAMSLNPNLLKYIKSISDDGNRLYFETIFSDQGIWLVETDNEEYYKVTLFKE